MTFEVANTKLIYASDQKLRKYDVDDIFKWLKTQPHLPEITELQILLFLRACFYDKDEAKQTIDNYFTLRTNSNLFRGGASEELFRRTLSSIFMGFLPKRTPGGDAILFVKLLDPRPEKYNCVEHTKVSLMIISLYFHQFGPANGLIVINDTKDTALGHLLRMKLSTMKQLLRFLQEAAPTKINRVHVINVVPVVQHMLILMKPFMKMELYNAIQFHAYSMESMYEHIPKECLPEEYGGELPSIEQLHEKNVQNIINNLEFFEWHDSQTIDETKRILKAKKGLFGSIQEFFRG